MKTILIIFLIFLLIGFFVHISNKAKRNALMKKYNDELLVNRLMDGQFWQGQTKGELIDSIGNPKDISRQVFKTKTKETLKYQKTGNNRYALKIFIEDGFVIGWDKK